MQRMTNLWRVHGAMANQAVLPNRLGIVTAYDPTTYSVKVQFPPDASETGWVPLDASWVGNGWGMFCPPALGDQVAVAFQDGGQDAGVVQARFFDTLSVPLAVQPGEFWLVHQSGQFVKLTNDGKLTLNDGHGAQIQLDGAGNIASQGTWTHTGNATINGTLTNNGIDVSTHGHQSTSPGTRTGNMEA